MGIALGVNGAEGPDKVEKRVEKIHRRYLIVDSHTDTPMNLVKPGFDIAVLHDSAGNAALDFPKMKKGGVDAAFFAVFVSQGSRDEAGYDQALKRAMLLFDTVHAVIRENSRIAGLALTPADAYRLKRQGKRAIFIGMENGYPVGKDLDLVQTYFNLGARYITLCHLKNNDICDSSTDTTGFGGLSDFGKNVVLYMNKLGMMVDVSHISDRSFYDVLSVTKAPVIASHSCARALCNHPRNLDDDMLRALAKNGGVIQVCLLGVYVKNPDGQPVTVRDVADQIDHIVKVAGINHVGIGSDLDGGGGVKGCSDVGEMKNITRELISRGYSDRDIGKIWGGNLMRVMHKVSAVSGKINKSCGCN